MAEAALRPRAIAAGATATRRASARWWLAAVAIPAAVAGALLVWGERVDFMLTDALYQPTRPHFPLVRDWLLETVFHRAGKWPLMLTGAGLIGALLASAWVPRLRAARRVLVYLLLAITAGSGGVATLKHTTGKYCPRELARYGGFAPYVGLLDRAPAGIRPGRCWPGGHSTSGFGFFAFYFALRGRRPRAARGALAVALLAGTGLGTVRVLQGAHFMSHTLWAGICCWLAALGAYALVPPDRPRAVTT